MQDFNTGIIYNPSSQDIGINSAIEIYKNSFVNPSAMWFKDYGVNGFPYLANFEHMFSFVLTAAGNYPLIYSCTNRNIGVAPFRPPTPNGANTAYADTEQISLFFVGSTLYIDQVVGIGGRTFASFVALSINTEYWVTVNWDVTSSPPAQLFVAEVYSDPGRGAGSLIASTQLAHAATEDKRYIHTIGDYGNAGTGSLIVRDLDLGLSPITNAIPPGMFGRGR